MNPDEGSNVETANAVYLYQPLSSYRKISEYLWYRETFSLCEVKVNLLLYILKFFLKII